MQQLRKEKSDIGDKGYKNRKLYNFDLITQKRFIKEWNIVEINFAKSKTSQHKLVRHPVQNLLHCLVITDFLIL